MSKLGRESVPKPPSKVLPAIKRYSLLGSAAVGTKQPNKAPVKLADGSLETKLLDERTPYQNLRRVRIYAKNRVLKTTEKGNFEKLKSDVASGNLVLETVTWSSDDSSSQVSPSGTSDEPKSGHKEITCTNSGKKSSAISQLAVSNLKEINIADKGQSQATSVSMTHGRRINEPATGIMQKRQLSRGHHFGGV